MDKTTKYIIGIVAVVLLGLLYMAGSQRPLLGGATGYSSVTVTTSSVGVAKTQVIAADANRQYFSIQNNGLSPIYCLLDGSTAAASSKVATTTGSTIGFQINYLAASTTNSLYENYGYTGVVNCAAAAASVVTITTAP